MGSVVGVHGLYSKGSIILVHGLSCSLACGIFLDQGLNWCPPAWQGGFLTIGPSGKPSACTLKTSVKLCHLVLLFPSSLSTVLKPVMFSVYLVWGFYLRKCASSHLWSVLGDTLRWWVTAVAPGSLYCLPRVSDFHGHHLSALPSPRPPECPWLVDIFQIWFYLTLHWFWQAGDVLTSVSPKSPQAMFFPLVLQFNFFLSWNMLLFKKEQF